MKVGFTQSNQYSESIARKYIVTNVPVKSVATFIETQYEHFDKKRKDAIKGYRLWFVQEGINPFIVKFEKKPKLPSFLSIIEFENLQGIEIRNNVYFKADGIKVVK
ncbi:hypothetical protein COJ87_19870 [Bacillus cereus]|uniref:hypothetical protein n=1 Tax=Bacillus cereus TaxID=1396 RepID=UPI000BECA276|nr:hypothetical protein [Bacillus cereus]PEC89398.1 hypothetical protein CON02_20165 [Bacillus cereus]PFO03477.1 hypothetical protein COJ68_01665 [Bacillus cereus]PFO75280.1 hypothetical protein COJ87_19870 [Bacillus cereus]PGN75015.1 hypothetical protein CN963_28215 [Bacillus cereus]